MSDKLIIDNKIKRISIEVPKEPAPAPLNDQEIGKILKQAWEHYKKYMITKDGRPLGDQDLNDIDGDRDKDERVTFSEGVSYALLRAVWMNDEDSFYKTWIWAKDNLQRKNIGEIYHWNKKKWIKSHKNDHLFAWRYVPDLKEKEGGVIHMTRQIGRVWRGGLEGASDADLDIAAALIFAWKKWKKPEYLNEARSILNDVWKGYVKKVNDKYYLFAGDQFVNQGEINPSYLRPFYFSKLFPAIDPSHPWQELAKTSYEVIEKSGDISLKNERNKTFAGSANLPPDWVDLKADGSLTDSNVFRKQGGQFFGWDAFRTLFAVAMDYAWSGNPKARKYLTDNTCTPEDAGPYCFLKKELDEKGKILGGYNHDGSVVTSRLGKKKDLHKESFFTYGVYLPFFYYAGDMEATQKILDLLQKDYNKRGFWKAHDYYGQNWAWLGLALINYRPDTEYIVPEPEIIEGVYPEFDLPEGFSKEEPEFALDLINAKDKAIKKQKSLLDEWIDDTRAYEESAYHMPLHHEKYIKALCGIFDAYSIIWLFEKERGTPNDKIFKASIKFFNKSIKFFNKYPYLSTKIKKRAFLRRTENAIILASEPIKNQKLLEKLGFGLSLEPGESKKEYTFRLLNKILKAYQKERRPYSKLMGQIYLQLALHAPDEEKAEGFMKEALKVFDGIIKHDTKLPAKGNKLFDEIASQGTYDYDKEKEFFYLQGQARMSKAQLTLLEAGNLDDKEKAFAKLEEAYKLLKEAVPNLKGFHLQQLKQLAAESLIRQAFILKDLDKAFQNKLDAARALLYDILNWEAEYNEAVTVEAKRPRWLKEISSFSKLWLAKLIMFEAGEIKKGARKEYILKQRELLLQTEMPLRKILTRDEALNQEGIAEAKRNLAESLARRAFIAKDLGEKYAPLLDKAKSLLEEVSVEGSKLTKAEADLWLAKILMVEAGTRDLTAERENILRQAQTYLDQAFSFKKLKAYSLSSAHQTQGEIYLGLEKFDEAKTAFEKALDASPRNYEAQALGGDVLNWKGKKYFKAARDAYLNVPKDEPAYFHAALGMTETKMRELEDYSEIDNMLKKEGVISKILENEPPRSHLIARAVDLLIEALRSNKDWHDRLIAVTSKLLDLDYETRKDHKKTLESIKDVEIKQLSRQAKLYLALAETLTWERRYDDASEVLNEKIPANIRKIIDAEPKLAACYALRSAEIKMRKDEETEDLFTAVSNIFAKVPKNKAELKDTSKIRDPYLIEDALSDMVEAYSVTKDFEMILSLADVLLGRDYHPAGQAKIKGILHNLNLNQIKDIYSVKGLEEDFEEFKFELWLAMVDALTWTKKDKDLKLEQAIKELKDKLNPGKMDPLSKAQIHLRLGKIYYYDWNKQDHKASLRNFKKALKQAKSLPSKGKMKQDQIQVLAEAHLGLGDVRNFGKGKDKKGEKIRNFPLGEKAYNSALKYIKKLVSSEKQYELFANTYLGLTKLEQQKGNPKKAAIHLKQAKIYADKVPDNEELEDKIVCTRAFLPGHYVKIKTESFMDGQDRVDNRFTLEGQFPLWNGLFTPTLSYQLISAEGLDIHSFYAGAKSKLLEIESHSLTLEAKFRFFKDVDYEKPRAESKYWWSPDLSSSFFYSNKYFMLGAAADLNFKKSEYNSYYATFMANIISNLQAGLEYNHYLFTYTGEKKTRDDFNAAFRYTLDLAELGLDHYDRAKLRFYLAYPYLQYDQTEQKLLYSPLSFKAGAGIDIHLFKGVVLSLDCSFVNQDDYNYGLCSVGIKR